MIDNIDKLLDAISEEAKLFYDSQSTDDNDNFIISKNTATALEKNYNDLIILTLKLQNFNNIQLSYKNNKLLYNKLNDILTYLNNKYSENIKDKEQKTDALNIIKKIIK